MDKCSFTNGSCQHTEEGGWACSLMFLCLCNAPQLTTAPTVLDFQATKATFKKGSCSSRPKLIQGTVNVGTERKRGGNALYTHASTLLYSQFTAVQPKSFHLNIWTQKEGEGGGEVEVMIKRCLQTLTPLCLFSSAALLAGGRRLWGGSITNCSAAFMYVWHELE